jgi:hypothetical protein
MPLIQLKPALERGQYYNSKIYTGGEVLFVETEDLKSFEGMIAIVEEEEDMPDDSKNEAIPGEPTPPDSGSSEQSDEAPNPSNEATINPTNEEVSISDDATTSEDIVEDTTAVTQEVISTPEDGSSIPDGGANPSKTSQNRRRRG